MKIWIKNLLGIALGFVLFLIIPTTESLKENLTTIAPIIINIARYVLIPLILFSTALSIHDLIQKKKFFNLVPRMVFYTVFVTFVAVTITTLFVIFFSPEKVPLVNSSQEFIRIPSLAEVFTQTFPKNFFDIFTSEGNMLIPVYLFSIILGLSIDKNKKDKISHLSDILSSFFRLFYKINSFLSEIVFIGLAVLSLSFFINFAAFKASFSLEDVQMYRVLIFTITGISLFLVFIVFPLLNSLFLKSSPNYKWLIGILGPALAVFFSNNLFVGTASFYKHGKESLGISESAGSTLYPFTAMFCRAGTALISVVSFLVILKSYSSLEITLTQILWISSFSFIGSFLLFSFPEKGLLVSLIFLCSQYYISGFEEGFLILIPVLPLLARIAATIDFISGAFTCYLTAEKSGYRKEIPFKESV